MITIYTDGSSKGNPGPGGWAAVIEYRDTNNQLQIKEIGGRENHTTNNRMEMRAVIEAMKTVPMESELEMYSDSEYLIKGITEWVYKWQANGWKTKDKRGVLNQDLWEQMIGEAEKRNVSWLKVEGHSGHKFNDRCDKLATGFADGKEVKLYNGPTEKYFLMKNA
jgi:ribonuclease HI